MATSNPTIQLSTSTPLPNAANQIPTAGYLATVMTSLVMGDFTRDNINRGLASLVTISASSPASPGTGELWLDTSASPPQLKRYDGNWVGVAVEIAASAPSGASVGEGMLWFDTTLQMLRVYKTFENITGWHPVDRAYALMTNNTGSQVDQYGVVVRGTGADKAINSTTTVKDTTVVGVAQEDIADNATGVVATVAGGAYTNILVDNSDTDGAIVAGDGLVSYSTAFECRTVGPINVQGFTAADHGRAYGMPLGCFAEALGTKFTNAASDVVVFARLLGSVGEGRTVWRARATEVASMTESAWTEFQVGYVDASHAPMMGAYVGADLTYDIGGSAGAVAETFQLSVNQNAWVATTLVGQAAAGTGQLSRSVEPVFVPSSSGSGDSYAALGDYISYNLSNNGAASPGWSSKVIYSYGYVY